MHSLKKETPTHQNTAKQNNLTPFRPLHEVLDYEQQFIDPQYQQGPHWDHDLYHQEKLEFGHNFNKSPVKIEEDDIILESHESEKLRYALMDMWTNNP